MSARSKPALCQTGKLRTTRRLCQLLQACLAENDQTGLMVFVDLEKAYDRVSYTYLEDALEVAGQGQKVVLCIHILYNANDPMRRKVALNCTLS